MHCLKQHSFCYNRESRTEFSRAGEPEKIRQNVRLLLSLGGTFLIAAAGTFLFADSTGYLLTDLAPQAISSLHRSDKTQGKQFLSAQIRRAELCKDRSCSMQNLHIARRQKSRSSAEQHAEHDKRNAAGGAGNINYQFYRHRFAEPDFTKI